MAGRHTLGARIKQGRQGRGWTQAQLARVLGISRVHVGRLEAPWGSAYRSDPRLSTLEQLAKVLETSMAELLS